MRERRPRASEAGSQKSKARSRNTLRDAGSGLPPVVTRGPTHSRTTQPRSKPLPPSRHTHHVSRVLPILWANPTMLENEFSQRVCGVGCKRPEKTALFWGEREYSYRELWKQTVAVSSRLREEFGVRPGDRVGLWLNNCREFIPALFGVLHAGGVVVPINNFLKTDEVSFILERRRR